MGLRRALGATGLVCALVAAAPDGSAQTTFPLIDWAGQSDRQVVVDREPGQYLGHPTTVLLPDGRTILAVYPKGHGRGAIVMKRSADGGLTWSERLPTPASWSTSLEVPTIYRIRDTDGSPRMIMFSGLYPIRMASSDDLGRSWTELEAIGDYGGIVAMASLAQLESGELIAFFHDDGRFFRGSNEPGAFIVYQVRSTDGGRSWGEPEVIASMDDADLSEPGLVWSPDGRTMALLLRENRRAHNSFVIFSNDEGRSWSEPREVPWTLTGDRHVARYAPDGRLFVTFRDMADEHGTRGDWVGWVGRWEDLVEGGPGELRVRLMDNRHEWDTAYAGLELLPDGTFVTTTYGYWTEGQEPYIVSVRFTMDELRPPAR